MQDNNYDDTVPAPDSRHPLTPAELSAIKDQLLESVYVDIGRKGVKAILWIAGVCILAMFTWLTNAGHIKFGE